MDEIVSLIPAMTSNSSPSGLVKSSSVLTSGQEYQPFRAFDGNISTFFHSDVGVLNSWISYTFSSRNIVKSISITSRNDSYGSQQSPREFIIQGSNDELLWVDIQKINELSWYSGETKTYDLSSNDKIYKTIRLLFQSVQSANYVSLSEIKMYGFENVEIKRYLILNGSEFYYYDSNLLKWSSLGSSPTSEEILQYGLQKVTQNQIQIFEGEYGNSWIPIKWTDGDPKTEGILLATPKPQILTAKDSIQLTGVVNATFNWTATGTSKIALSINDGITYHAFKNGVWDDVTNDMSNAMTASEYSAITWEQYKLLAQDSNFLKHQYYIPDNSAVDDILITVELMGINQIANSSSYELSYDQSVKTIRYSIKSDGTYFANYVDISTL